MRAAVFRVWMYSSVSADTACPSDWMSTTWPPTMRSAGRPGDLGEHAREHVGRGLAKAEIDGHEAERVRQERVAREHGHRLAEDLVVREAPAPVVVVIHRRQIVVDRASTCGSARSSRRSGMTSLIWPPTASAPGDHQDGPETLAAREDAVPHRLVDHGGGAVAGGR